MTTTTLPGAQIDGRDADPSAVTAPDPCPDCGAPLAAVTMHADDRAVTMRSCSRCDRRWWTADGEAADPTVVFARR